MFVDFWAVKTGRFRSLCREIYCPSGEETLLRKFYPGGRQFYGQEAAKFVLEQLMQELKDQIESILKVCSSKPVEVVSSCRNIDKQSLIYALLSLTLFSLRLLSSITTKYQLKQRQQSRLEEELLARRQQNDTRAQRYSSAKCVSS